MKKRKLEREMELLEAEQERKIESHKIEEERKDRLFKIKLEIINQLRGPNLFQNYSSISFTFYKLLFSKTNFFSN